MSISGVSYNGTDNIIVGHDEKRILFPGSYDSRKDSASDTVDVNSEPPDSDDPTDTSGVPTDSGTIARRSQM